MKKVNVFIASSAELDEDKTRLDLFFAEKNKIYEKRGQRIFPVGGTGISGI